MFYIYFHSSGFKEVRQGQKTPLRLCENALTFYLKRTCVLLETQRVTGGERIRAYRIEAQVNGKWTTVAKGTSVGHKRIESFPAVEAKSFRLVVEECTAEPLIRNFSVYHVNP